MPPSTSWPGGTKREKKGGGPPPTPPRPEPVATADLVAQARERSFYGEVRGDISTRDLLTALAAALEDTAAERDRALSDLALERAAGNRLDEIATQALAERDRAHATLREIVESMANFPCRERELARERLENP